MTDDFHDSAYDGLLDHHTVVDDSQWAFGTDFEDPLAGVYTTIPSDVDPDELAAYCLMLGDDALVYSHRLSEWCSHAPTSRRTSRWPTSRSTCSPGPRPRRRRWSRPCPAARRCHPRTRWPSSAPTHSSATCDWSSRTTATS